MHKRNDSILSMGHLIFIKSKPLDKTIDIEPFKPEDHRFLRSNADRHVSNTAKR